MSFLKEFKEFATKGNVVDLAIGVIIGSAFGKIVSSLVADIIMPPIGMVVGGVKFTDIKLKLKEPVTDAAGKVIKEGVTMNIGSFSAYRSRHIFVGETNKFPEKKEGRSSLSGGSYSGGRASYRDKGFITETLNRTV